MMIPICTRQTILSAAILACVAASGYSTAALAEEPIGQVIWVKGAASAGQAGAMRQLERRSPIYEHDEIVTGVGSSGQIAFTDSSVYTLRGDTDLKVDEYHHQAGGPASAEKSAMSLIKGGFRTITGVIPKENPEGYQTRTPVATIGVRGTDYSVFFSADEGLKIKLDVGAIDVYNQGGTLQLNTALAKVYGSVTSINRAPAAVPKQPAVFSSQPSITPVSKSTINTISTTPPPTGVSGGSGPTTPSGGSTTTPSTEPAGPAKTVSSFCVGLLEDLHTMFTKYFG